MELEQPSIMSKHIFDFDVLFAILSKFRPVLCNSVFIVQQALVNKTCKDHRCDTFAVAPDLRFAISGETISVGTPDVNNDLFTVVAATLRRLILPTFKISRKRIKHRFITR